MGGYPCFLTMATKIAKNQIAVADEETKKVMIKNSKGEMVEYTIVPQVLKNTRGEDVPVEDYFYAKDGETAIAPNFFNTSCGYPTDRDDLIEIFDKVFKPEDNFLLLKARDKEVYSVLVPLKFTDLIGLDNDSILGDYQLHAMSFIPDGSVNYERFKSKVKEIAKMVKYNS